MALDTDLSSGKSGDLEWSVESNHRAGAASLLSTFGRVRQS